MRLTSSQARILVIDDDKSVLETITHWLRHYGFILFTVGSGKPAFDKAQQTKPDLILLDLVKSDLNDVETYQLLKTNPYTNKIPIIFLTEIGNLVEKIKDFAVGEIDYLVKPLHEPELITRITICLREQQRFLELQHRYKLLKTKIFPPVFTSQLEPIHRVQQYLLENLDTHHSLAELAHLAYTNRNKLNRSFQARLGMSIFDWLREQRLQKAAELLHTTPLQIQEISRRVGYTSHAHFTTRFKQRFQVTPKQYKKQKLLSA